MATDAQIKRMHKAKLKSYSDRELGMQIGACLNKAVDIVIASGIKGRRVEDIESDIGGWTDILFKIGSEKKGREKQKELDYLDAPEMKAQEQGEEKINKELQEAGEQTIEE